ncbi:DUF2147 domain-containing protein [Chitinophaga silvisoli]|uniref:DUF2147 domain-containing protein n=1 Tax=Chitinophaga silvisoli TaxID=2291814 RepID=A0A3E1NWD7_9BACT|nr:DUF2147 domain-containing protein [Chitinophaga silvisoli]RFM32247.1 DUF2147 domain-containing protein [Chitinophaga silvisoli]
MKRIAFLLITLLFSTHVLLAQDKILGNWLSEEKDGRIEIYKTGDKYFGKLVWGKDLVEADGKTPRKDRTDTKNSDPKLRSRPLLGLVLLTNFTYDDGEWSGGKIYDPKSGKTYSCTMKMKGDKLEIRGYVGVSMFGRTTVWTRG